MIPIAESYTRLQKLYDDLRRRYEKLQVLHSTLWKEHEELAYDRMYLPAFEDGYHAAFRSQLMKDYKDSDTGNDA